MLASLSCLEELCSTDQLRCPSGYGTGYAVCWKEGEGMKKGREKVAGRARRDLKKAAGDALVCSLHAACLHQFGAAQAWGECPRCSSRLQHTAARAARARQVSSPASLTYLAPGPCGYRRNAALASRNRRISALSGSGGTARGGTWRYRVLDGAAESVGAAGDWMHPGPLGGVDGCGADLVLRPVGCNIRGESLPSGGGQAALPPGAAKELGCR